MNVLYFHDNFLDVCWKSRCDDRSPWSVLTRGGLFIQTNYAPWMSASVSCLISTNEIRGLTINDIKEIHSLINVGQVRE